MFLKNANLTLNDQLPFQFIATWDFNNRQELANSNEIFDITLRNVRFFLYSLD